MKKSNLLQSTKITTLSLILLMGSSFNGFAENNLMSVKNNEIKSASQLPPQLIEQANALFKANPVTVTPVKPALVSTQANANTDDQTPTVPVVIRSGTKNSTQVENTNTSVITSSSNTTNALAPSVNFPQPPAANMGSNSANTDDYVKNTEKLLQALKVNAPPESSSTMYRARQISRDQSLTLSAGLNETINMVIGGSLTVSLPGAYDQAVVVVPDVADVVVVSPGKAHIIARGAGNSDIIFSNTKTGQVFKVHAIISLDMVPIQQSLDHAFPAEHFIATSVNGAVYLTGTTRNASVAAAALAIAKKFVGDNDKNVINKIIVLGGQQVMLKVQVAEVRRSIIKQFGLNSSISNRTGSLLAGNNPGAALNGIYGQSTTIPAANSTTTSGLNAIAGLAGATNPAAFISTKILGSAFTSVLSALETEGLVRTLAEPNLVAISGKSANMLAGGQYPVPSVSQDGRLGTDYHNFGVSLGFTPTVMSPGVIGLDMRTEVSEIGESVPFPIGSSTVNIPVFNTRSANTSVELPSGGTLVIAGLLQNNTQNTASGLPGIKDLPILGKLFSSTDFQKNETELVITVTAYLVEPNDPNKVSLPTEGLLPPSDGDIYLFNRLNGMYSRRGGVPVNAPNSKNFGYITE